MSKQLLITRLKQCSYSPPIGAWTWEVQRRCYCFAPFLEGYMGMRLPGVIDEIHNSCPDDYLLDHLANIIHSITQGNAAINILTPPEVDHDDIYRGIEAACKYIVDGDYESLYVPQQVLIDSYQYIKQLQRDTLTTLTSK